MSLEFDDIKVEMIERSAHAVKPVFGFDDEFMVAMSMRPFFLLFAQRTVMPLATQFHARPADPAVKNFPVGKFDDVAQLVHEFGKLEVGFNLFQFVADLV